MSEQYDIDEQLLSGLLGSLFYKKKINIRCPFLRLRIVIWLKAKNKEA